MASLGEYRLLKYNELPNDIKRNINETLNACRVEAQNGTLSSNDFSGQFLSYSCDFCEAQNIEELWTNDICDHPEKTLFHICVYIMYTLILILAVVGNLLVVYSVCSCTKMKTVTNYFISNLAIGDLCITIFCVPFSFLSILILQYWPFGFHLCVFVNYMQAVSVFVSAYTLVAISIDRYMAIIYPLRPRMPRYQAKIIIFVVWTLSLLTTLPIAYFSQLMQPPVNFYKVNDLMVCQEDWGRFRQDMGAAYSSTLLLLQYFLPIVVLIFTYTRIAVAVWRKKSIGEHQAKLDRLARSKRKTIEMMIMCVTTYTLSWLPLNIYNILRDIPGMLEGLTDDNHFKLFFGVHWLAMAHTCCNPIIYFWMNPKFRSAYLKAFSHCKFRLCEIWCPTACLAPPPSPFFTSSVLERNQVTQRSYSSRETREEPKQNVNISCCLSCYCDCCSVKVPPAGPTSDSMACD